ncbi:MAG: hypothetical protein RAK23_05800 [Thermoplasmata archaeon]|nr:hypothetical protein [Thermoplasmata archaeon]
MFNIPVFLAAMGITLLEISEASAVGLALYAEGGSKAFIYVGLGIAMVLVITFLIGSEISLLPILFVRIVAGFLLLYFGLRLVRSARRSVLRARKGNTGGDESLEKGLFYTGFSVGAIEAFEAAIVLIALIPIDYTSTLIGLFIGLIIVIIATIVLRTQIRKVKQANMKVAVSALLLSFSLFWILEAFVNISDLYLILFFAIFFLIVYAFAHRK